MEWVREAAGTCLVEKCTTDGHNITTRGHHKSTAGLSWGTKKRDFLCLKFFLPRYPEAVFVTKEACVIWRSWDGIVYNFRWHLVSIRHTRTMKWTLWCPLAVCRPLLYIPFLISSFFLPSLSLFFKLSTVISSWYVDPSSKDSKKD